MPYRKSILNLYPKVVILVWIVVAVSLLVTGSLITRKITDIVEARMGRNAMNVAKVISKSPSVILALKTGREDLELQEVVQLMSKSTHLDIVIFDNRGEVRAQLDPNQRRTAFVKPNRAVIVDGREYTSVYEKGSEYSLQAYSPVFSSENALVGVVAVGISLDIIDRVADESNNIIVLANIFGLVVGMVGALILARNIKKILFGLEPTEMAKVFEERNAIIESVKEAVIAVDKEGRITLLNNEARKLLNLTELNDPVGRSVEALVSKMRFKSVLRTGQAELDIEQEIKGVKVLTNQVPVIVNGQIVGAVATFRDKTELKVLAEQLTGVRNYVEALRSQAHEFMNKLHVILGMVKMEFYDELTEYVSHIARGHEVEVNYIGSCIHEPVLAGFFLGKLSRARELGVELLLDDSSYVPKCSNTDIIQNLIVIIGNLIDNAFDAVQNSACKKVIVKLIYEQEKLCLIVSDTGQGIDPMIRDHIFETGFSTKADNRGFGLALVKSSIEKLGGNIKVDSSANGTQFLVNIKYPEQVNKND